MLHRLQQTRNWSRHTGMTTRYNTTLHILTLIVLIAGTLLAAAPLLHNRPTASARGMMPEVVCTADRPNYVTGEIVVCAPRPDRLAGAVARVTAINR